MNKTRNNKLMGLANKALIETRAIFKNDNLDIDAAYNGQIASLGVTIAMSGIRPALAIYFQDKSSTKVNRRAVLTVIADMIKRDDEFTKGNISDAKSLFEYALKTNDLNDLNDLNALKEEVEQCSIALKQVVRTYNLV